VNRFFEVNVMEYNVLINMAKYNEKPMWQDIFGGTFDTMEKAHQFVAELRNLHGDDFEYGIRMNRSE
jgi:hypothetical protein